MEEIIRMLIKELKKEYMWRAEAEESGGSEAEEGWSMKEAKLREEISDMLKPDPYEDRINKLFV